MMSVHTGVSDADQEWLRDIARMEISAVLNKENSRLLLAGRNQPATDTLSATEDTLSDTDPLTHPDTDTEDNEITVLGTLGGLGFPVCVRSVQMIGRIMAVEWLDENPGKEIPTIRRLVGGTVHHVRRYSECDRPLLERIIREFHTD